MGIDSAPEWHRPPVEGYTADDLDRIPDLPPHTELIDGTLVIVSPQKDFHTIVVDMLTQELRRLAPKESFRVRREMSIVLAPRQRPEPDVIVLRADTEIGRSRTWYPAEAVVLAVEVVSPESEIRDRQRKPQLYAEAGIPYFWLVEESSGAPVVHAYERRKPTGAYELLGSFRGRVILAAPFDIDIDLTGVDDL
ncbi:restriction endonuclease [Actinoplanes utahensis]|uniref:Restriction endonuclease n=1 Tax=Actinoplanes utahensis TaxID=1869 RepID=A0A0A6ULZ1_ACTUT|nr:restriction endonuclease [Actinoplanes utahensis]